MNSSKSPFRIRIGVTGHRAITDQESIARKVKEILRSKIYELLENEISQEETPALTLTIVTPLAEGADRLIAKEVLKFPESDIEVVLPFAKDDYMQDFETEQSRQEFEELYRKSQKPIVLKNNLSAGALSTIERTEARNKAYEDVGRYVVTHCDVLIALWDGRPSRGRGGTAEIVAYAREEKRPLIIISTENLEHIVIGKVRKMNELTSFNFEPRK